MNVFEMSKFKVFLLWILSTAIISAFKNWTLIKTNEKNVLRPNEIKLQLFEKMQSFANSLINSNSDQRSLINESPLSWEELSENGAKTSFGKQWKEWERQWEEGAGPPHTNAKLRLFGRKESEVELTFYRDSSAWCPYCQKVWMMLEEKKIPYKVVKINMRSYGEKPASFLKKVPSGLLPAIEFRGEIITESIVIMQTIEFQIPSTNQMLPDPSDEKYPLAIKLLKLERKLFGDWCQFLFRSKNQFRDVFHNTLLEIEGELGKSEGPWFLGGPNLSIVDLTYVPHLERMAASCAYWKGFQIRGNKAYPNINRWFEALEEKESYMATKSDFYTHVMDIPPQYGNGIFSSEAESSGFKSAIEGKDGISWKLQSSPKGSVLKDLEPVLPVNDKGEEWYRHEAACMLIKNCNNVVRFSCRGAGRSSGWNLLPGRAPLADPNATPNENFLPVIDELLRFTAMKMLSGEIGDSKCFVNKDSVASGAIECLAYLRDRIGVPRDMSYLAAISLRSYINWVIDMLIQK